ncbi:flavin-containing monooxygenase FMO GS-OX-like 8 isoform X2 [Triticum dicoccoides]|nr:flavin-containing monooxygenase FMO GS-OX-like 8 isoform X2 [Triticum dicoccoides]
MYMRHKIRGRNKSNQTAARHLPGRDFSPIHMDTACGSKPPRSKKVCVIGAGMAGLAAARELRREGHDVTVLEQSGDVGGQWLYDPRTDADDALGVAAPVKVHSSIYASLRLISPRQTTGFTDFPFCPKSGRDDRRFPGHREVHLYLKDFCDAFGLMEAVRLNTRVLHAAMTPACKWAVRSMDLGIGECDGADGKELDAYVDEVFDAVVVASGHYSQPRLPSIKGMETWRGRQMHSHSYRMPEPFRGEVVVVVGCGDSGRDIAIEIRGVAKEVYIVAGSMEAVTPGLSKVLAKYSTNLHLRLEVERLCEDGRVAFKDGGGSSSSVAADTVIYCTGYNYSFPFLDTGGAVAVDDNRVGPLFEHVFPPSLAPSLSFVGLLRKVFAPRSFEAQARWVAQVLSGRRKLPTEEEMLRSVEEFYRAREIAGVPSKYTHEIRSLKCSYVDDFGEKYCDFPRQERWQYELLRSSVHDMMDKFETFRDDYQDSDSIRKAVQEWHLSCLQSSSKAGSEISRAWAKQEPGASK